MLFPVMKDEVDSEYVELPPIGRLANQHGLVGSHWSRLTRQNLALSEETLEVMGLYIAEGHSEKTGQVMFAIGTEEDDLTQMSTKWLEGMGLRPKVIDSARHRNAS